MSYAKGRSAASISDLLYPKLMRHMKRSKRLRVRPGKGRQQATLLLDGKPLGRLHKLLRQLIWREPSAKAPIELVRFLKALPQNGKLSKTVDSSVASAVRKWRATASIIP
jgi:hypothetical protein